MRYFEHFPKIMYNGRLAKNLMNRVIIPSHIMKNGEMFYPYTLSQGHKIYSLATSYYENPDELWIITLANGIEDIILDMYLTDEQIKERIIAKYGSEEAASRIILGYRNNYISHDDVINLTSYEVLPARLKKYSISKLVNSY